MSSSRFFPDKDFWTGKRVFITGHTGFKGAWLSAWLNSLGARVKGYALEPIVEPNLFSLLKVDEFVESSIGDILDFDFLYKELDSFSPDIVFHLAAQSLVIDSYNNSYETFQINTLGTASVLEALKKIDSVKTVVVITTDKVYENSENGKSFKESDSLGGKDPYSASKAAAEIVTASYRESFFKDKGVSVASARSGNVFGGGDWAANRIVPDGIRAFLSGEPLVVRNPESVRPWQFVLEPLMGYIMLGRACYSATEYDTAWNFGPNQNEIYTVAELAGILSELWGDSACWKAQGIQEKTFKEASCLVLDSKRSEEKLDWKPVLDIRSALDLTVKWYKTNESEQSLPEFTRNQITEYMTKFQASLALDATKGS